MIKYVYGVYRYDSSVLFGILHLQASINLFSSHHAHDYKTKKS